MANIEITIDDKAVSAMLEKAADLLEDTAPLMASISADMHVAIEENFKTEGHGTWPELAPGTRRQRARKYGAGKAAHPILQRSGSLLRKIIPDSDEETAWVTVNDVRAAPLHFGATISHPSRSQFTRKKKSGPNFLICLKIRTRQPMWREITPKR